MGFQGFDINFGSCCDALLGVLTIFDTLLTTVKVLLSLNIAFLHSEAVQCRYFLQMLGLFFFIAAVRGDFLGARRHGRPRFLWSQSQIDLVKTLWRSSGCLFFNSTTVLNGYDVISRFKS